MSRKQIEGRWCVRCNRSTPTPYLQENVEMLKKGVVVDIGCGNGRNSTFLQSEGFIVYPVDMAGDFGKKCVVGVEPLPFPDGFADSIIANYIFMFLTEHECRHAIAEIHRIAKPGCMLMIELYPARYSHINTKMDMLRLQKTLVDLLGWDIVEYSQGRCVLENVSSS